MRLSIVVPVFDEAQTVGLFVDTIERTFANAPQIDLDLVFVNDGSTDRTLERLIELQAGDPRLSVVDLSRNFGKEAALSAGLAIAGGDVIVPIDVDLQDPPDVIFAMIDKWREGYDVVVGRRIDRDTDTLAKRVSASWFYRVHNWLAELPIPENVGDFRLMDRSVVEAVKSMPESRRFMKGLFAWAGFRTAEVTYVRAARVAGSGKFGGWRLWNFALEGLTSFSTMPLRIWTYMGVTVAALSLVYGAAIALRVLIRGVDVPGYASLLVAITFLGGIQLVGIGVLGEYLGRTYIESKRRPIYFIRRVYNQASKESSGSERD